MNKQRKYRQNTTEISFDLTPVTKEELNERRKMRRKRKRIKHALIGGGVLFTALLVSALVGLIIKVASPENRLAGKWDIDGITGYQFNKGGTGAMLLPHTSYEFTYEIEENNIILDFKDEKIKDGVFSFEVNGDKLILKGEKNTTGGTYELKRIKE